MLAAVGREHARLLSVSVLCVLVLSACANTPGRRSGTLLSGDPLAAPSTDSRPPVARDGGTGGTGEGVAGRAAPAQARPDDDGAGNDVAASGGDSVSSGGSSTAEGIPPSGSTAEDVPPSGAGTAGPRSGTAPGYGAGAGPSADGGLIQCGGAYAGAATGFGMIFGYSMPTGTYEDPFSVTVDYGDSSTGHALSSDFDQLFRHLYAEPGTFTAQVTITGAGVGLQRDSCTFSWSPGEQESSPGAVPAAPGTGVGG